MSNGVTGRQVRLSHPADLDGFRAAVRTLVAERVPPAAVTWLVPGEAGLPLGPVQAAEAPAAAPLPLQVPRRFVELAEKVICHRDPARFALLHDALLRLQERRDLLADRADPLVDRLEAMAASVGRAMHKMRAFLRFRATDDQGEGPHYVAWFEPDHHILRANCGFFVRRFASQRWTILTPEESAYWDGERLHWLPGASRADAPAADPVEAIWKTYYANIFNPARVKLKAMTSEMPRKYWANMPEAALIPELVRTAPARVEAMVEAGRAAALERLRAAAAGCTLCPLHAAASQTVFGEGPEDAALMIVGEQPGDQEDLAGRPFVGPAGQLLDRCLAEAGIARARAYVTNAVKHFKFEARGRRRIHQSPASSEIETCRWWLDQERAIIRPRLVLMLGASAGRAVLGRPVTVSRERGRVLRLADGTPGFLTIHPSFLLRIENEAAAEAERARFVADLRAAAAYADGRRTGEAR